MSPATSPIPLLLVADSADTCERIASALLSAPAFYRIERVTSSELIQNGPSSEVPLALVDGNLRAARQAQVVSQLNGAGMAVVALVDSHDVQTLQEVVLAGATALVATPFVDTQLWETVAAALTRGARPSGASVPPPGRPYARASEGMVVAVYAPKGGSGSSVLAGNLAIALQQKVDGGVALLENGEDTGSQAVLLNIRSERTLGDLLARFDPEDTELLNSVLSTHPSGLRVLLAAPTPGLRIPPDMLGELVDALRQMFTILVIDVDSSSRNAALNVLRKAHAMLVVVTPEMTSLQQGRVFVETVEATMPEVKLNIVLNRSTLASGVPADAIRKHLRMQIVAEIPDDQPLITASVNRGVPVMIGQPRSGVARAIDRLAHDLLPAERPKTALDADRSRPALRRLIGGGRPA